MISSLFNVSKAKKLLFRTKNNFSTSWILITAGSSSDYTIEAFQPDTFSFFTLVSQLKNSLVSLNFDEII